MYKFIDHHVHTTGSLLDGMVRIEDYVNFGKEQGFPALFISDHGSMGEAINFYVQCKENGIKPIIGEEFYISTGLVNDENEETKNNYHLCLYAKNLTGYKNLVKLTTYANLNNFYSKPRITFEELEKYKEGLICTTACIGSQWGYYIRNRQIDKAIEVTKQFKKLFEDDFYIELGYHNFEEQVGYVRVMKGIADHLNIKTVIGNDVHYLRKDEELAHKIIMCKGFGKTLQDTQDKFDYSQNYYKTNEEIKDIFKIFSDIDVDKCFENTYEIINKCENYEIKFGEYIYPELPLPEGQTQTSYLFNLVKEGLKNRYPDGATKEVLNRVKYEFTIINKMSFCGYFNMVHDYINWAKSHDIKVGLARGSCGGCLVAYVIGITDVDSLKYDLFFERFLNPSRVSFPDIDTDFEPEGRSAVIQYLTEKYTQYGCVPISTRGYLKGKSAIKTVASKLGLNFLKYNGLLSHIKDPRIDTIDKVIESDEQLQKLMEIDTEFVNVIKLAKQIEGNIQSVGVHASGVIVCHKDISDIVPIIKTKEGFATGYTDKIVEKLGLIKYDILGLKNLIFVKGTEKYLGKTLDLSKIPLDDEKTYETLRAGKNVGVFQLESDGMKSLLTRLQPSNIDHINAIVALFRPGAMQFIDEYIENKNNPENIKYFDPRVEPILKETYGQMVYQEQVMKIAQVLAGYTMAEADSLRHAIGKKKINEMMEHQHKFIDGCVNNGMEREKAETLYNQIVEFANYSFNKSHSVAYGIMAYITAYLKTNYPLEYMTAVLNSNKDNLDKINTYIDECYRLGINILVPDINKSDLDFMFDKENNAILFGFTGIKGIGESAIEPLLTERKNGEFTSFENVLDRIPSISKTVLENLIKCGAFDSIEKCPRKYLKPLEIISKAKSNTKYKRGEETLYNALVSVFIKETLQKNHREYIDLSEKVKAIKSNKKEDKQRKDELKEKMTAIQNYVGNSFKTSSNFKVSEVEIKNDETELMGFSISCNPKKTIIELEEYIDNTSIAEMNNEADYGKIYSFMGRFKTVRKTKNGSYFAVITDDISEINTFMKRETYELLEDKITSTSNYFRFTGYLNRSNNEKFADSFKIEGVRYFNAGKDSVICLRSELDNQSLSAFLTKIRDYSIMNMEDINYRLVIYHNNKKLNTKIDYWVSGLSSIASEMIRYNVTQIG